MSDQQPPSDFAEEQPEPGGMRRLFAGTLIVALGMALVLYIFRVPGPPKAGPLVIGSKAPDFSLQDAQKNEQAEPVMLSHLVQNGPVAVIFNMGLHCTACTETLLKFASRMDELKKAGVQVIAVSDEPPADTRADLATAGTIPFPLLWDPENKVAKAFGLEGQNGNFQEVTFLIDKNQQIQLAIKANEPGAEIDQILDAVNKTKTAH